MNSKYRRFFGGFTAVAMLTAALVIVLAATGAANAATNATLNTAHKGATNPGFEEGECPTPPAGKEGWWGWHFVFQGSNTVFVTIDAQFV